MCFVEFDWQILTNTITGCYLAHSSKPLCPGPSGIRHYSCSVTPFCRCLHLVPAHCIGYPKPLRFCIRKKCGLLTGLCLHNCFIDIVSNQPVSLALIETSGGFHPLDKYPRFPLLLFRKICILQIYSELPDGCAHAHAGHIHAVIKHCADSAIFERNNI